MESHHFLSISLLLFLLFSLSLSLGYVNGTFLLVWRRQDEEEIALDHCSTATLLEMGMAEEPKRTYLLIRTKDDAQPEKVQNVCIIFIVHWNYSVIFSGLFLFVFPGLLSLSSISIGAFH